MKKGNNQKINKNQPSSMNKKRYLIMIVIIVLLIVVALYVANQMKTKDVYSSLPQGDPLDSTYDKSYEEDPEDENRMINTSDKLSLKKEFQGITISNVKISQYGEMAEVTGDITNVSGTEIKGPFTFYLVLTNKQGDNIKYIKAMVKDLKAGATVPLLIEKNAILANAYDYHIISEEEYNNIVNSITADEGQDE